MTNIQEYEKHTHKKKHKTGNYVIQRTLVDPKNSIIVSQKVSRQGKTTSDVTPQKLVSYDICEL